MLHDLNNLVGIPVQKRVDFYCVNMTSFLNCAIATLLEPFLQDAAQFISKMNT